jgi:hypothetical protein
METEPRLRVKGFYETKKPRNKFRGLEDERAE